MKPSVAVVLGERPSVAIDGAVRDIARAAINA